MQRETYGFILVGIILLLLFGSMSIGHGFKGFGTSMGLMLIIVFWAAVILMIIWLAREKHNDAIEILKERYSKGEISKKQFEQLKKGIA